MMGLWVQMTYGRTVWRQEHRLQQTRVLTGPANWTTPAERYLDRHRRPLRVISPGYRLGPKPGTSARASAATAEFVRVVSLVVM